MRTWAAVRSPARALTRSARCPSGKLAINRQPADYGRDHDQRPDTTKPPVTRGIRGLAVSTRRAPEGIRTPALLIRSQMLYPAELRARVQLFSNLAPGEPGASGGSGI